MKAIELDDVLSWLRSLPLDTIVYQPDDCNHCVVATYGVMKLGVKEPKIGYIVLADDADIDRETIEISEDLTPFINRWDAVEADKSGGLTARAALAAVQDLLR